VPPGDGSTNKPRFAPSAPIGSLGDRSARAVGAGELRL
jgi:hypothetical protein